MTDTRYAHKDESGLFLVEKSFDPAYREWRTKTTAAVKEYLRKHATFFTDDFWKESGIAYEPYGQYGMPGIIAAARTARWLEPSPELRTHYPVRQGQPWGGKKYRVWTSLLYPDKEPVPPPLPGQRPVVLCRVEGCGTKLRWGNLSGICTAHRNMVPGRRRAELISEAARKASKDGRIALVAKAPEKEPVRLAELEPEKLPPPTDINYGETPDEILLLELFRCASEQPPWKPPMPHTRVWLLIEALRKALGVAGYPPYAERLRVSKKLVDFWERSK